MGLRSPAPLRGPVAPAEAREPSSRGSGLPALRSSRWSGRNVSDSLALRSFHQNHEMSRSILYFPRLSARFVRGVIWIHLKRKKDFDP